MRSFFVLLSFSLPMISGCDDHSTQAPESVAERTPLSPAKTSVKRSSLSSSSQLGVELVSSEEKNGEVHLEVSVDRPLPFGGRSRPSLVIDGKTFRRSKAAGGRADRIVFMIDKKTFDELNPEAPIEFHSDLLSNKNAPQKPRLTDVVRHKGGF